MNTVPTIATAIGNYIKDKYLTTHKKVKHHIKNKFKKT